MRLLKQLLIVLLLVSMTNGSELFEVHNSSWSGGRVRSFALSFINQASDVLECAAVAAKHLLDDQLLVFIGAGDGTQQPQCIIANRSGSMCRILPIQQPSSVTTTRVFVTSYKDCWISIQYRVDNSTSFSRNWTDYASGFGHAPLGNHWLGLQTLHSLTWPRGRALRIRMRLWNDTEYWVEYAGFAVDSEANKFRLNISGFQGSDPYLQDCLTWHNGAHFSAIGVDNDDYASASCSDYYKGGWWFTNCYMCYLNGLYYSLPAALSTPSSNGIVWKYPFGVYYSMKEVEMLIK